MTWLTERAIGLMLVVAGLAALYLGINAGVLVVLVGLWMAAFGDE